MSALKDLKKRLSAVQSTKQLTSAMKTVSSIKFSRINNILGGFREYSASFEKIMEDIGAFESDENNAPKTTLYVLISGNRGLCGGYNIELFSYFDEIVKKTRDALFMACGKKAIEHCRQKDIPLLAAFDLPDIPDYSVSENLYKVLRSFLDEGRVERVLFVCQKHINLLKRQPQTVSLLSPAAEDLKVDDGIIFIPDKETVLKELYSLYQNEAVYSVLLNCAAGVQAATLTAMRSAFDTANESAQALEISINRRRQADVTASVIETAADNNYDLGKEV